MSYYWAWNDTIVISPDLSYDVISVSHINLLLIPCLDINLYIVMNCFKLIQKFKLLYLANLWYKYASECTTKYLWLLYQNYSPSETFSSQSSTISTVLTILAVKFSAIWISSIWNSHIKMPIMLSKQCDFCIIIGHLPFRKATSGSQIL